MTRLIVPSNFRPLPMHGGHQAGFPAFHRDVALVRIAALAVLSVVVAGCTAASSGSVGQSPEATVGSTGAAASLQPASLQPLATPTARPDASTGAAASLQPASARLQPVATSTSRPVASTGTAASLPPASLQPLATSTSRPGRIDLPALVIDPIVADIARLAAVAIDKVTVQSAESVTFPDGGLGCPVPGIAYSQVQVDGYQIVAVAAGVTYDYRGTAPGRFRLCTPQK